MNLMLPLIESFGISDIGLARANNEDVWAELPDEHFFVLADGMGGHLAGEVAAREAVLHLCDAVDRFIRQSPEPKVEMAEAYLRRSIVQANHWIRTLADQHPELYGMGTTLCCLLVLGKELIYAHVGDSRIYRFRGKLEKMTEDHSLRAELLARGDLNERSATTFPYKNVLTRALGTAPAVQADVHHTTIQAGDIYFLCSDGLHDCVSDRVMEKIMLNSSTIKEAAIELVETAKAGGGNDNITVLVIKAS